jgi:hypothetical protein
MLRRFDSKSRNPIRDSVCRAANMHGSIEARAAQQASKFELSASRQKRIFAPHKSFDRVPQNRPRCFRFPAAIRSKI